MNAEISQHASGHTWLLCSRKKNTRLYQLWERSHGCQSVIRMKLTKTGSGWDLGGRGGGEAEPDRKPPTPGCWVEGQREGAYFGSKFSREFTGIPGNCQLLPSWGKGQSFRGLSSAATACFVDLCARTSQLAAPVLSKSGYFSLIRGLFKFLEKQNDWVWLWVSTESNFNRQSTRFSLTPRLCLIMSSLSSIYLKTHVFKLTSVANKD